MDNFLCPNCSSSSHYTSFDPEVMRQLSKENHKQTKKISNIQINFWNYTNFWIHNALCQTVSIFRLHILPKLLTTYLTQFCVISYPQLIFIFNLAYNARTDVILWSSLNHRKLRQCVDTSNFLPLPTNFYQFFYLYATFHQSRMVVFLFPSSEMY